MEKIYEGVAEDPRSEEQKALDYKHEDLAQGEVVLKWVEYNKKNLNTFPIQNQDGSSSCVAQGTAKILAMHEVKEGRAYKQLCPKFIYDLRQNYPSGGMWLPNALSIACKYGSCEEKDLPCEMKGETFMNDKGLIKDEHFKKAEQYKAKYYFQITGGIDKIAEVLEQGYGVLLWFRCMKSEWTDFPEIKETSNKYDLSHGVACTDYCLYKGKKALLIEDSWGVGHGKGGRRIITEDFINAKCVYAGYLTSLPNFVFTKTLRMGSKGIDVRKLQEKLNELGYILKVDGYFGMMTYRAVVAFQQKHKIVADGIVGKNTNNILNSL